MRIYNSFPSLFVFLLLFCLKLSAQEETNPKKLFIEAESYFLFEEYKDALPLYQQILRVEPENYNVQYKIGICYLNDVYLITKSIQYLEKASKNISPDYRQNNYREKKAPLEAYYYLGRAYHINNMLDKAIENYRRFRELADPAEFNLTIVDEDIDACQLAKKMLREPIYFSPVNVRNPINTRFEEINPVVSGDGNTLIFTRKLQFYDGVFISRRNSDGTWSEPENLTPDFGLDGNSYSCGISYFGDEIFVYRSDNFDGNIYSSKMEGERWSPLIKLNDNINTKYWESHASPSVDGEYLYFTSNRSGGYGGLDIYKSKRNPKGDWQPAVNLGPVINSPNNEETPFISNEGYTLFFSSQGHKTIGGYDVFISNLQSDGTWSKPRNMGSPLNTTGDDLFYCPMGVNSFGFMALFDENNTEGMLDIYEVEVYNKYIPRTFRVQGKIITGDADPKYYRKLKATILDANTKEIVSETKVEDDGKLSLSVSQGEYILFIEGPETETFQQNFDLTVNQPESLVIIPEIVLEKSSVISPPIPTAAKTKIKTKSDFYAVTDSSIIPIDLIVPKGADLDIRILVNDSLIFTESVESVRKRFTYFYKPKPGENLLEFTATDPEGGVSSALVSITYYLPLAVEEEKKLEEIVPGASVYIKSFGMISEGILQKYLRKIEMNDFDSYSQLYRHLIEVSDKEGFTSDDVNRLFSIYFSQKDKDMFDSEFKAVYPDQDTVWETTLDSSSIPLIYVKTLVNKNLISKIDMQNVLLELLTNDFVDGNSLYGYLSSFQKDTTEFYAGDLDISGSVRTWELFTDNIGDQDANSILQLASTTEDLQFFFQNVLIAASSELKNYLAQLQIESLAIHNSVDLLNHLFDAVKNENFTYEELIKTLEKVSLNRRYYLNIFNEVLTNNASGTLKSQLLLLNLDESQINTYENLLKYLVEQSQYKNYSREEVYNLLLDLIGITGISEFSEKIKSYNIKSINDALADTSLKYFSNPFELLQYLLVVAQDYHFTESDINNLLIRMILERGLSERLRMKDKNKGISIWKNKKFLTAIVLVNVVILIVIILITLKRKK